MAGDLRKLDAERARAQQAYDAARSRSDVVTPGGLRGDPATLSGVRRKPNARKDSARNAAYRAEAEAAARLRYAQAALERAEAEHAKAIADLSAPRDIDSLKPGDFIRDSFGWHRVVRVNAKSVAVPTPWSWTDRIPFERIIETRPQVVSGVGLPAPSSDTTTATEKRPARPSP